MWESEGGKEGGRERAGKGGVASGGFDTHTSDGGVLDTWVRSLVPRLNVFATRAAIGNDDGDGDGRPRPSASVRDSSSHEQLLFCARTAQFSVGHCEALRQRRRRWRPKPVVDL